METVHRYNLTVTEASVDRNRHVNNIAYVQWMQDGAIQHAELAGGTRLAEALGATWVVRTHRIEYFSPAFAGDEITVETWVADFRRVRSLRRYRIIRARDGVLLAEGETDWVFVDAKTRRPRRIPEEMVRAFGLEDEGVT
jgi:acyl-CoA thioester hydrolase